MSDDDGPSLRDLCRLMFDLGIPPETRVVDISEIDVLVLLWAREQHEV